MQPSFYTLFKRGRYLRSPLLADEATSDDEKAIAPSARRELERYASAAVAFCLKHSADFQAHFYRSICKTADDPDTVPKLDVTLEPPHWADLRLIANTDARRTVWVVEFKVWAELEKRQNPTLPQFARRNFGYGALFAEAEPQSQRRYILLGVRDDLGTSGFLPRLGIAWHQRRWSDLLPDAPRDDSLVVDLFDSLGSLRIGAFTHRQTNDMKITSNPKEAAKAYRIVHDVVEMLGLKNCVSGWAEGRDWSIGADLLNSRQRKHESNQTKLARLLSPPAHNYMVWFGYINDEGDSYRLDVQFYCAKSKKADSLKATLEKGGFKHVTLEEDTKAGTRTFNVVVWTKNHKFAGDRDWFWSVFKSLGLKPID